MDKKSKDHHRFKRRIRGEEDDQWDCSVCTYINPKESYKCEICHTRKGTSTRKPRLNTQVVEQQQLIAQTILKEKDEEHKKKKDSKCNRQFSLTNLKLKNFDRSSPLLFEIFANGYSVVITEFQPKSSKAKATSLSDSPAPSNCSSHLGFTGSQNIISDQLSPTDVNSVNSHHPHHLSVFGEYEFMDSTDIKPPKHPEQGPKSMCLPSLALGRHVSSTGDDRMRLFRSYSSASSSVGGNTLSQTSSPHNSMFEPCLTEVKREQAALDADQAAHDGDDECDEEEEDDDEDEDEEEHDDDEDEDGLDGDDEVAGLQRISRSSISCERVQDNPLKCKLSIIPTTNGKRLRNKTEYKCKRTDSVQELTATTTATTTLSTLNSTSIITSSSPTTNENEIDTMAITTTMAMTTTSADPVSTKIKCISSSRIRTNYTNSSKRRRSKGSRPKRYRSTEISKDIPIMSNTSRTRTLRNNSTTCNTVRNFTIKIQGKIASSITKRQSRDSDHFKSKTKRQRCLDSNLSSYKPILDDLDLKSNSTIISLSATNRKSSDATSPALNQSPTKIGHSENSLNNSLNLTPIVSRLSTESKNTSAMTDSSGATALEITT